MKKEEIIIYPTLWKPAKIYHCPRDAAIFSIFCSVLLFPVQPVIAVIVFIAMFLTGAAFGKFDPEFFGVFWRRVHFTGFSFKNRYFNIRTKKLRAVEDKFPLVGVTGSGLSVSKDGQCARIIEITGKDYAGLSETALAGLYEKRKSVFLNLPPGLTVSYHAQRMKTKFNAESSAFVMPIADEINKTWSKNFTESYITRHFLIVTTKVNQLLKVNPFFYFFPRPNEAGGAKPELIEVLNDFTNDLLVRLKDYGARELKEGDLASYYGFLLNGTYRRLKMPENGLFDDLLTNTDLEFTGKNYQIYDDNNKKIYSGWLIIKTPAESTTESLLNSLFRVQVKFSVYQTFSAISQEKAIKLVHDKFKNAVAFIRDSLLIVEETEALKQRLQANEISLFEHTFAIEVFGADFECLEENIRSVRDALEINQYVTTREKRNIEVLYWSRFPSLQYLNPRKREITSDNVPHFVNLGNPGEGQSRCSWGDAPVTVFKTFSGSQYRFTFHHSEAEKALGNTLVIGGSESGKTTLISFLLTQAFKFPDFRALCFDRLHGLKVWTRFLDGKYSEGETLNSTGLNPLQLSDTEQNRAFLQSWFEMLLNVHSDTEKEIVNNIIRRVYKMPRAERFLSNLSHEFGKGTAGSLKERLNQWLPGGSFGGYFSQKRDALTFENPLVTIDNTSTLDNPDLIAPLTYYLFHRLFDSVKSGGYAVFVDELNRYIESEHFASKIVMLLREIRKTNGVLIGAVQNIEPLLENKIASTLLSNIATFLIFPEPRAIKHFYCEIPDHDGRTHPNLGLNEAEFRFIQEPQVHKVLLKRRNGESVMLDVNLSSLGKHLNIFNSNRDAVQLLSGLENKPDWKTEFFKMKAG